MAELTTEERLALAVRAEVARQRADQAQERTAFLERKVQPFMDAVERFEKLRRRRWNPANSRDLAEAVSLGGKEAAAVTFEMHEALGQALEEAGAASAEAGAAMAAVMAAWGGREGGTVLAWVGVDRETFDRAVEGALAEEA